MLLRRVLSWVFSLHIKVLNQRFRSQLGLLCFRRWVLVLWAILFGLENMKTKFLGSLDIVELKRLPTE
jgi:hypothetical protein